MQVAKTWVVPLAAGAAHRKRQSTVRSVAYYRDAIGKNKKRALNAKRTKPKTNGDRPTACPAASQLPGKRFCPVESADAGVCAHGCQLDRGSIGEPDRDCPDAPESFETTHHGAAAGKSITL